MGVQEGNIWRDQATWLQLQPGIVDDPTLFPLAPTQAQPTASLSTILRRRKNTLETLELDAYVSNWVDNGDLPIIRTPQAQSHPSDTPNIVTTEASTQPEDDDNGSIFDGPCPSDCDSLKENHSPREYLSPTTPHSLVDSDNGLEEEDTWHED